MQIDSNKRIKAASTALILIIALTFYSFVNYKKPIRKIITTYCFPSIIDGKLHELIDSTSIIYKDNFTLYEMMPNHTSKIRKDSILDEQVKYKYFIIKKGERYGFLYDSLNVGNNRKLLADSLLQKTGFLDGDLFKNRNKYNLNKIIKSKGEYAKIEIYIPKVKEKFSPDTTLIYYSKELKNIEFSLSQSLDSDSETKVCKIQFVFNSKFDKDHKMIFPQSSHWFLIKEDISSNLSKYDDFINAFRNQNN
ncbi:hypothetical protein [Flavobacterium limnophilum]|uniref:hypothetical protein n=1 Tax=Flavobacterium limnophilum TaxID=3003262 RepID=UPI0024824702|nr:hypothetical protein [Flavobacterium limnophilum]